MGKKSTRPSGARDCTCDKCGATANSIPETRHRWCKGSKENRKTNPSHRGTWR